MTARRRTRSWLEFWQERIRTRLTKVVHQVKTAKKKELADFMQYLEHKYNQIHNQLDKKSRLAARGEARVGQSTTTSYQDRAAGELLDNKSAQLEIFRAEADSRRKAGLSRYAGNNGISEKPTQQAE